MASREEIARLATAKERLVREGELYRLSTLRSKHQVSNALHPQALLHGAVDQAIGALQARLGGLLGGQGGSGSGFSITTVLPYVVTAGTWVARKRMWKPALAVGVLVAGGIYWLMRREPKP